MQQYASLSTRRRAPGVILRCALLMALVFPAPLWAQSTSDTAGRQLYLPLAISGQANDQSVQAAVSLSTFGAAYSQDFNTLASSSTSSAVPTDWAFAESGTNANGLYTAGTGSGNAGDTYSFGPTGSSDRAFGGLRSGSLTPIIGVQFTNNTGGVITSLSIAYTGEQWRAGVANRNAADRLDFQLSTDATSLTTGTWTDYDTLDFNSANSAAAVGALDGNAATNRTTISAVIANLAIANGATFWLRWADFDIANSDDGLAVDDFSLTPNGAAGDTTPVVTATSPANGAIDVALNSNIEITFSEAVNATSASFTITCASGSRTATVSGGPTTFTLNPDSDFAAGENCTVTVLAANVTDQDGATDAMTADYNFSFTTLAAEVTTPISAIQGSGATATVGTFTVEAIVVGDYQTQGSGQLRGFFIQEEDSDADANPATSEGIFVFCSACPTAVSVGDKVRVTGASSEFFNMSQLTASTVASVSVLSLGNPMPTAATIQLPVPGVPSSDLAAATAAINAYFEPFEGMLVTFPATLAVSEYFELARYGQVILSEGGRPRTFTDANTPSATGLINHEIDLASRTIILDDTDNRQNRPVDPPNTAYYHPTPGLSTANFFRGGDTITNLTGVLHWSFAGQSGTDAWRIRPVTEQFNYAFTSVNPRPTPPTIGGTLKVASFNVLNYFLTIDTTSSNSVGACSPSFTLDCRGADSLQELERQRAKLTQALLGLDADIVGVIEMENTPNVTPPQQIVADLNAIAGPGVYAFIDTGVIGTDAIRVGLLYKPAKVTPVGAHAILDSTVDPNFIDTRNRPALAQTFAEVATNARFTVVVNHFKSKGSGCGPGDDDTTTGQGNCNGTRTLAAQALAAWLATDPTGSGDPDVLIIGDLNAYAKEDPIVALQNAGYTNLVAAFGGADAYSFVFDGQLGYLDHALANASLTPQVADVTEWHINADEIPLFDYNDDVRDGGEATFEEESDFLPLYAPDAFRTADHDPVLVGLTLDGIAPVVTVTGVSDGASYPYGSVPVAGCDTQDAQTGVATAATISVTGGNLDSIGAFTATCSSAIDKAGNSSAPVSVTYTVLPPGTVVDSCGGYTVYRNGSNYIVPRWSGAVRVGTDRSNTIIGSSGADLILGLGGNDLLTGNGGDDLICGGNGVDLLLGLAGNDTLDGGAGNDVLNGGSGDYDQLIAGGGNDTLLDGDGVLMAQGGIGNDLLTIALRNGWRDSHGEARFAGLAAGYDNDIVGLLILDPTRFLVDITGDERDEPPSPQEGNNDRLSLAGVIDPASTIIKFEQRLVITAGVELAIPADDAGVAYLTEPVGEEAVGGSALHQLFLPLVEQ